MIAVTKKLITNTSNRPGNKLRKLKGIIIHWTANAGKNANANAHYTYFQNHNVGASAHYFVDDKNIVQIIPDDEVAYHVGSRSYTAFGNTIREGNYSPNHFLIGIEMCVNPESNWDTTYQNTLDLTGFLLSKYNLSQDKVWRHYDITGKDCPKMMCYEEDEGWTRFLNALKTKKLPDESKKIGVGKVLSTTLNVRMGNGSYFGIVETLSKDDTVSIYESIGEWYRIGKGKWVSKNYIAAQPISYSTQNLQKGIVNTQNLNIRNGASTLFSVIGKLNKGDQVTIYNQEGDWYHIGENRWVYYNFIDIATNTIKKGIVTSTVLNIRKGAGTNQAVVGEVKKDDVVTIMEERNGWYKIGNDQWVYAMYVLEIKLKTGKVISETLNVRKGPGVTFDIVGSLTQNQKITIEAEEGLWYRINKDQWVHRNYVTIEEL